MIKKPPFPPKPAASWLASLNYKVSVCQLAPTIASLLALLARPLCSVQDPGGVECLPPELRPAEALRESAVGPVRGRMGAAEVRCGGWVDEGGKSNV